jgi:glycosyltransferase involved in cell wall biosynthesis
LPTVSVLIPCHNAAPWLQAAVNSVRAQTYRDLEILIYDDGSTDGSGEVVRRLAAIDPRIDVMGVAINSGI